MESNVIDFTKVRNVRILTDLQKAYLEAGLYVPESTPVENEGFELVLVHDADKK